MYEVHNNLIAYQLSITINLHLGFVNTSPEIRIPSEVEKKKIEMSDEVPKDATVGGASSGGGDAVIDSAR